MLPQRSKGLGQVKNPNERVYFIMNCVQKLIRERIKMTKLDFSGLMSISDTQHTTSTPNNMNATLQTKEGINSVTTTQFNRLQRRYNSILETYKALEETRKNTSSLKVNLIHDLNAGDKDLKELLKDSLELIGIATRDAGFTNHTIKKLKENY